MTTRGKLLSLQLVTVLLTVLSSSAPAQQPGERLVKRVSWPNEPIKITSMKIRGVEVKPGEKFKGDEDWFRGLTVKFDNTSGRPICFIHIAVRFPRPVDDGGTTFSEALMFACDPVYAEKPTPFNPGESMELVLTDEDYARDKDLLAALGYPATIDTVEVEVYEIRYHGDENMKKWSQGQMMRQEPDHPGEWIPIKP